MCGLIFPFNFFFLSLATVKCDASKEAENTNVISADENH